MRSKLFRLVIVAVLLVAVVAIYVYGQNKPVIEEPEVLIPLGEDLQELSETSETAKAIVDLTQKFYYNAWLTEAARRNGGWRNITALCTEDFASDVTTNTKIQDSISLGSIARNVNRVYLDRERSRLFNLQVQGDEAVMLADVWLGVDQKLAGDYFLHQQAVLYYRKEGKEWKVSSVAIYAGEEKPADLIPED